jgi:transposase-like protein
MKYTKEIADQVVTQYREGTSVEVIAASLGVPTRSVIAEQFRCLPKGSLPQQAW